MIQFSFLNGKKAGTAWVARRFPVRVGRGSANELPLAEAGIWDEHFSVEFHAREGFMLVAHAEARTAVNGAPVRRALLHNGDVVTLGALRMQFWLAPTRQAGLAWREWLTWACILGVCWLQVVLVYWLRA